MKYCGGHNLPTNNVNTVTLFLMYQVIRISCLLRAILASSVAPLRRAANIALNNQVFETLKSFEPSWNFDSTVQDVTQFLEKASKVLQRTINIVNLKGEEQVFKFKSAKNVQAEPYHLCVVSYGYRGWLSITSKNVQNTLATQMEPKLCILS